MQPFKESITAIGDHRDSILYMNTRRRINEEFAKVPVDFYAESLNAGQLVLGRDLTSNDTMVDIGSSTGEIMTNAANKLGVAAQIICIDSDPEVPYTYSFNLLRAAQRVRFVMAEGENIPIAANSLAGATMHNVIFRAEDAIAMLAEAKRVVMPNGFIAVSTNYEGHAIIRHALEKTIAKKVMEISGVHFEIPQPPAFGRYIDDLPKLIKAVGGLEVINKLFVNQDTQAIITPGDRADTYIESIKYSGFYAPDNVRAVWRRVSSIVIDDFLSKLEMSKESGGPIPLVDTIKRGMYMLRKTNK